jgi:hypothetical protein
MRRNQEVLTITDEQRSELSKWAASRTLPAGDVFRARLILALAEGVSYRQIMATLQTTAPTMISKNGVIGPRRENTLQPRSA